MVVLHISYMVGSPYRGVDVVVPKHVQSQEKYACVGILNINDICIPNVKNIHATSDDLWIFFSTIFPANAADIPRKNIAKENAHPTANVLIPIWVAIASLNVDQQYTVPIEQWISKAGIAALNHLLLNFITQYTYLS